MATFHGRRRMVAHVDRDAEEPPHTGPIVRLRLTSDGLEALIDPPLPDGGQHRREFPALHRDTAWGYARNLAAVYRLGFTDESSGNWGRTDPNSRTLTE